MSKESIRIISIGAAIQDIFLRGKVFAAHKEGKQEIQEFVLGSKNEVESIVFSTGGGATNAAVTFARHGFDSGYMGMIGDDIAGKAVLEALHKDGVDTALVSIDKQHNTGASVILLSPNGERTVLTYRGASNQYAIDEHDFDSAHAQWLYISSLSGDFAALQAIVEYAKRHDIKVAINPGKGELQHNHHFLELLPAITILGLNKEEMQQLYDGISVEDAIRRAAEHIPYILVTDGPNGAIATDGTKLYRAGVYQDVPVVDRIGAGDAFNSGFVAKIAQGESVEAALTFASANSTSVVSKIGAKAGILSARDPLHTMPIDVSQL